MTISQKNVKKQPVALRDRGEGNESKFKGSRADYTNKMSSLKLPVLHNEQQQLLSGSAFFPLQV